MNEITVPISPGELLDKITILRIKSERIHDPGKLANVRVELGALEHTWQRWAQARASRDAAPGGGALDVRSEADRESGIEADIAALMAVNTRLWDIEDRIRDKERAQAFDAEFIRLARAVYIENDERAAIKRRINLALGSRIVEEKSYAKY
jgi:hypothetical protein